MCYMNIKLQIFSQFAQVHIYWNIPLDNEI